MAHLATLDTNGLQDRNFMALNLTRSYPALFRLYTKCVCVCVM